MDNFRVLIHGLPGSGKSTYCAKRIIDALASGYIVFSNIQIEFDGHTSFGISRSGLLKNIVYFAVNRLEHKINKLSTYNFDVPYPTIQNTRKRLTVRQDILYFEKWRKNILNLIDVQTFPKENYFFTKDFDLVVDTIKKLPVEQKKIVIWDEGFIDFSHQNSPSSSYTEFFNQGRHFNCDLVIASQRAVAVFPAFRALCDYSLQCRKRWRFIEIRKYYLDSSTSLPAGDDGKVYDFFLIKKFGVFFNTIQRFI